MWNGEGKGEEDGEALGGKSRNVDVEKRKENVDYVTINHRN